MSYRLKGVLALAAILVLTASVAVAQETTGSINGTVADENGTPIAGAAVVAEGPSGKVSTVTDEDGFFRFPRLNPGEYQLQASLAGFTGADAATVRVVLGQAVTVNFGLQQSTFTEEIMVYSDTVSIDFTESQIETSIREWEMKYLPRGRDFTDVVTYAAGTTEDNQGGGIMVDGASGLENRYIIDGLDTTSPELGTRAIPIRAEMFEEVQVKSAGYMAEFGGAMGGVINAVTKSGSNQWHGSLFADYENSDLNGSQRGQLEYDLDDPTVANLEFYEKDKVERWDPGFSIGGPILRDRWWFFASYIPGFRTIDRYVEWVSGATPDTYRREQDFDYVSANTTVNISSALLLKGGVNMSPYTQQGSLPGVNGRSGNPDQESWRPLGNEFDRETYYLNADWIATDSLVISGRAGYFKTNTLDTGIPFYDIIQNYSTGSLSGFVDRHPEIPSAWQQAPGYASPDVVRSATAVDQYERTAGGIDATLYFQGAGDHSLKFGVQTEEIENEVADGYNADRILYYWDRSYTTTSAESVTGPYGYFRLLNISTQGGVKSENNAIFIQDAWSVLPNLTLNIGVRAEQEAVPNYGVAGPDPVIDFDWNDKLAPRLGFAWDIMNNAKWKLYGSYGQYFDVIKYHLPRGLFGADKWVDYFYTFDTANPALNDAESCRTNTNTILERPTCPAGTFIEAADRRFNSADPLYEELFGEPGVDPDLKPMQNTEYQIGVDHQFTSTIQLGARVVRKEINRTIEDVGILVPGVGEVYTIANPGEGISVTGENAQGEAVPWVKPVRDYTALELTFDRRFANNWSLRAYYTLSRLEGNYSGLANSDEQNTRGDPNDPVGTGGRRAPNTSRLFDRPATAYDMNGDKVYGRLATDRTHQLGAQFLYSFPFGFSVGVNQYIGSGTPVTTIGSVPLHVPFYPFGRGDQGDTDWLYQTDLSMYFTLPLGGAMNLTFGATILNLFDSDTTTRYWGTRQTQDLQVTDEDFLTGFNYAEELAALGASGLDTRFMMADTFQLPREVRLHVKFEF